MFNSAIDYVADLIVSEAVKEIGKNIGKAVANFVGFAFTFIGEQVRGFWGWLQSKEEKLPVVA